MSEHGSPGKTPFQQARAYGAKERQAQREARTVEEQLALLDTRRGNSTRERARLLKEIARG